MSEKAKYQPEELVEFKKIIDDKLAQAKEDLQLLMDQVSQKDDHGTDDTAPSFKLLDDGSEVLSRDEISQLVGRQQKYVQNLENALVRIKNGTYGVCRVTGNLISKERLRVVPHATLSIEAKNAQ
jgi:RNA polymerase-binding transcription factor DksA